ncbi:MAG: STM3941 family protein [Gammaproteobacteria bacterium]
MAASPVMYYMSKKRAFLGTLLLWLFIMLAMYLILSPSPRNTAPKQALAFIGIVLPSFALFIVVLSSLIARGPAIVLSDSGLRWNVSLIVRGQVKWQEIQSVSCVQMGGAWFVNLNIADLDAFIATQPFATRLIHRWMVKHQWPVSPASLPGTGVIDATAGKIAQQVRKRLESGI